MKRVLVSQRVVQTPHERRDALDHAWHPFLRACGLLPILVPNVPAAADVVVDELRFDGILLTGGNDVGGDAPERDDVEESLLRRAAADRIPVLGVCRGMQMLVTTAGGTLHRVEGHVMAEQVIRVDGVRTRVNSYHHWGCTEVPDVLEVWARADDGVVKAVRHRTLPFVGVLWHPERMDPFRADDIALFRRHFRS